MSVLTSAAFAIALKCAPPSVDPDLLSGFATVESGKNPLAIHQNVPGSPGRTFYAHSIEEAVQIAARLIAAGSSVDTGTFQINNRNLDLLQISLAETFDTCKATVAASRLLFLMSRYNSGSPTAALAYARRVTRALHVIKAGKEPATAAAQAGPVEPPPPPRDMAINDQPSDPTGETSFIGD